MTRRITRQQFKIHQHGPTAGLQLAFLNILVYPFLRGKKRVYLVQDTLLDREVAFALIKTEGLDEVSRTRIARTAWGSLISYSSSGGRSSPTCSTDWA